MKNIIIEVRLGVLAGNGNTLHELGFYEVATTIDILI